MLFGYLNPPAQSQQTDVLCTEASIELFAFDRPLVLPDELHIAGAMAFATTFGFGGMSLIEWALVQSMSNESPTGDQIVTKPEGQEASK